MHAGKEVFYSARLLDLIWLKSSERCPGKKGGSDALNGQVEQLSVSN